jgi:hypothetical protein
MIKKFVYLENVKDLNTFYRVQVFEHVNGVQQNLYFRLTQQWSGQCPEQDHQRYLPGVGSTVTITFNCLDQRLQVLNRPAVMAFPNDDRSIWMVPLLATDVITGAGVQVTLSDPTVNNGLPEQILPDGRIKAETATNSRYFG